MGSGNSTTGRDVSFSWPRDEGPREEAARGSSFPVLNAPASGPPASPTFSNDPFLPKPGEEDAEGLNLSGWSRLQPRFATSPQGWSWSPCQNSGSVLTQPPLCQSLRLDSRRLSGPIVRLAVESFSKSIPAVAERECVAIELSSQSSIVLEAHLHEIIRDLVDAPSLLKTMSKGHEIHMATRPQC